MSIEYLNINCFIVALSGRATARLPVREGEPYSSLFVFCYVCISGITFRYYFFPRYFKNLKRSTLWNNKQYTKNAINYIFKTKSSNDKSVKTAKNYQKNQTKLNTTPRHVFYVFHSELLHAGAEWPGQVTG